MRRYDSRRGPLLLLLALAPLAAGACDDEPTGPDGGGDDALVPAAATITAADVAARVGVLADDSMKGRDTPSQGLEWAASYIARTLESAGLEPAGTDGYLQRYEYVYDRRDDGEARLESAGEGGPELVHGRDFVMVAGERGEATGAVLWAGSPAESPDAGGLDMGGRVVLYDLPVSRLDLPALEATIDAEVATSGGGASAVGFLVSESFPESEMARAAGFTERWSRPVPMFWVREPAADALLASDGVDLAEIRNGGPRTTEARWRVRGLFTSEVSSPPNVVATIRGSDPSVSDQYVVVSAHFDHNGAGIPEASGDSIYNGADDNASGTAAVLEVAEALASLETAPARSVLFLLVSGEEKGLVGSSRFVASPTVPLAAMVADVNMDMVGRNDPGTILAVGGSYSTLGPVAASLAADKEDLGLSVVLDPGVDDHGFTGSDNLVFACRDIPALYLHSGLHEDYHRASDELALLDTDKVARVARLAFYLAHHVADAAEVPSWTDAGRDAIDGFPCR
ncbi:MAG: M28 family peptidase [Gemmatimonadota bacterium]|jgi:hypothetical protein